MKAELKWSQYKKVNMDMDCCRGQDLRPSLALKFLAADLPSIVPASLLATKPGTQLDSCRLDSCYAPCQVPVVLLDGEVIRDSSAIISRVAAEKDAEAAASVPAPQRGWFGRSSQLKADAASSQHTGRFHKCQRGSFSVFMPQGPTESQALLPRRWAPTKCMSCWRQRKRRGGGSGLTSDWSG